MVYVIIIAVVFTGLAAAIFWAAAKGRLGSVTSAMLTQAPVGRRIINVLLAVTYVGFGIVVPAIFLINNHNQATAKVGSIRITPADGTGRELFAEHCAVCHTLAAAAAVGKVGPNLDQIRPSASLVLHTIQNGCLQTPSSGSSQQNCLGYGTMPADVVQGRQALQVAHFVAKVAGQ